MGPFTFVKPLEVQMQTLTCLMPNNKMKIHVTVWNENSKLMIINNLPFNQRHLYLVDTHLHMKMDPFSSCCATVRNDILYCCRCWEVSFDEDLTAASHTRKFSKGSK